MKIAIFGTNYDSHYNQLLINIIEILKSYNIEIIFEKTFFEFVSNNIQTTSYNIISLDAPDITSDMAISFGGDGTFLATAQKLARKEIPILGINAGHLGFLADISEKDIKEVLVEIINGEYKIEQRVMLNISLSEKEDISFVALNEIAILRQDTCSMITLDLAINGDFVNNYKSDGLIIATPTGSTAYSLSMGGPIVSPKSENFIIVPMAPHSLTVRPLVIRNDCNIEIKVTSRSGNYQIAIDGYSMNLSDKTSITINKSNYTIKSIQPLSHTFFKTLRNKLMWGLDSRM